MPSYEAVGAAALALADELVRDYVVTAEPATFRDWPDVVTGVRLVPKHGAVVTIGVRPGGWVVLRRGHWDATRVPRLGDEDVDESVAAVRAWVLGAVEGTFREELLPDGLVIHEPGGSRGNALREPEYVALSLRARPGMHSWTPWPRRADSLYA